MKLAKPNVEVKPSLLNQSTVKLTGEKGELQNLYVANLPKSLDEVTVRRVFARYGKISSYKLISKAQFSTNIAYVGYFSHTNASRAFKHATREPELSLG